MFSKVNLDPSLYPTDPRFGVGPSLIPNEFLEELRKSQPDYLGTSHRQSRVINVMKELIEGLRKYLGVPKEHMICMGNGGASFLFEMIGLGLVLKKSAHWVWGEFSHKWYLAHKNIPWIETECFQVPYGEWIKPVAPADADLLCLTENETSTGLLSQIFPKKNAGQLLAIDATSSAGMVAVDFSQVDIYFFSPQKGFAGEGGQYVAILSPQAIERIKEVKKKQTYQPQIMDWEETCRLSQLYQTVNTPALASLFFLNQQIRWLNQQSLQQVINTGKQKAEMLYSWAQQHPLCEPFIKDERFRSHTVATIDVDKKISVSELCQFLAQQKIAYDIEGYRKLNRNQLRIGLFPQVQKENLKKLIDIFDRLIF